MESVGNGIGWQGVRLAKDQLVDEWVIASVNIYVVDDAWYGHSTTSCSAHRAVGLRIHGAILRIAMVQWLLNVYLLWDATRFARSENLALKCNTLEYQIHQVKYIYWIKPNVKSRQTISYHRDRTLKESETSNNRSQTHIQERTPFFPKPTICFLLNSRTINCFKMTDNFCRLLRIPIIQDVLIHILLPDNSYWVKGALARRVKR